MYNIFTFGAEYIDRKEDKRYLNNIENYNLYVLISKDVLESGEQMFSKSNLVNTIAFPKVVVSKGYKEKLGSESIITEGFVDGDERLGIAFNETNIDADSKTVFVPYEVYFDAEKEENEKYNSEFTFNIENYKNKILILVPKIDNYDDWRIFKAGERHKFFVAYFNFESVSNDDAYFWIIANNKDFDIVKTDYFYTDSTDVQDFNTALTSIETKFETGSVDDIVYDDSFLPTITIESEGVI